MSITRVVGCRGSSTQLCPLVNTLATRFSTAPKSETPHQKYTKLLEKYRNAAKSKSIYDRMQELAKDVYADPNDPKSTLFTPAVKEALQDLEELSDGAVWARERSRAAQEYDKRMVGRLMELEPLENLRFTLPEDEDPELDAALETKLKPIGTIAKTVLKNEENEDVHADEYFKGRKVVVFGVPGAFTPVCSNQHVPSYLENLSALQFAGADRVACISVNDSFVMKSWATSLSALGQIDFLADPNGEFVKAHNLHIDLSGAGLGVRSQRFAMIVDDGNIRYLQVEDQPGNLEATKADKMIRPLYFM